MVNDATKKLMDLVSKRANTEEDDISKESTLDSSIEKVPIIESPTEKLKKLASKGKITWAAKTSENKYFINPEDEYSSPIINEVKKKYHK